MLIRRIIYKYQRAYIQAEELYKRFCELPEVSDPGYVSHHVRILRILGRNKEAARYYEQFLDYL